MLKVSDPHHFRKMVAGACMVVAPLLLLIGMVIHPDMKTDEAAQLAVIADNRDAWLVSHMLVLTSLVLAVPAVLGLMHMMRERKVAYGHVGGGLTLIGLMALVGVIAIDGFVGWQMTAGEANRGEMVALYQRLYDSAGIVIPFFLMSFAFGVGMIALSAGLYRARAVQSWMAAFIATGAILLSIAGPTGSDVLSIIGASFLFVGLASVGRLVLRESDEEWEHTPEYSGFRPLAGMR
jgi:hypothetical protein